MKKKYAPEIRMNGFDVDWEKKKLSAVVDVYDGVHQSPKYTNHLR